MTELLPPYRGLFFFVLFVLFTVFETAHYELDDNCNWELVFTTFTTFVDAERFVDENADLCGAFHVDPPAP